MKMWAKCSNLAFKAKVNFFSIFEEVSISPVVWFLANTCLQREPSFLCTKTTKNLLQMGITGKSTCCSMGYLCIRVREGDGFDKIHQGMTFSFQAMIIWFLVPQQRYMARLRIAEGLGAKRKYSWATFLSTHINAAVNVSLISRRSQRKTIIYVW